jgi:hypothetical protein
MPEQGEAQLEFVSLADLQAAGAKDRLRRKEAVVEGLGRVRVREVTGDEVVRISRACAGSDGSVNMATYLRARAAVALEKPSLGDTFEQAVAQAHTILGNLPSATYFELLSVVEEVCAGEARLGNAIEEALQRMSDLQVCFLVLAKKNGWFADLEGRGLSELHDWAGYYLEEAKAQAEHEAALLGADS